MSVKNWNFSYNIERKRNLKQNILDTISLWGSIGVLWYSFISIIGEHFPEYEIDWWIIGCFTFILWIGYEWPKVYLKKLSILCRLAATAMPVVYIVVNFEKILDGVIRLAWFYLPYFNSYYKTNLYMGMAIENKNAVVAFTAISIVLWWLTWILGYGLKKRVLLVLFPVMALSIELFVGLSPHGSGLWYAFVGAILLTTVGSASVVKKVVAVLGVGISVLLSSVLYGEKIEVLATKEQKQELLKWQADFSLADFNLMNIVQFDIHFNWEQLNNDTPNYTGKIILEIETDKKPMSTIYLKGFYGTNYEGGNWNYDDSVFRTACQEAGKSQNEVAKQIFQMPYERRVQYDSEGVLEQELIKYKIIYTGTTGDVAYAPYGADYFSMDDAYTLMGDYLLKKSVLDNTIEGSGLSFSSKLDLWQEINLAIEKGFGNTEKWSQTEIDLNDQREELEWLNELSYAYLQVPESAEYLSNSIIEIDKRLIENELRQYEGFIYAIGSENYRRMQYAEEIVSYLRARMSYSLELDELPMGADPIEYALTESHEGYCMHFASAATLLLREVGVPARYVSGYAVEATAFETDEATGLFKAQVGDFMAHAWVEIYLDNIGWVHIEVTPGSSLENLPSEEEVSRWESTSEAFRERLEEESTELESELSSETTVTEIEEVTESTQQQNTEQNIPLDSETKELEGISDGKTNGKESSGDSWKMLGIVGGFVLLVGLIGYGIRYLMVLYEGILDKDVVKNRTRKAVKRINRRIWRILRFTTIQGIWKNWTDIEYRNALVERFVDISEADWDRYMEIVKKNYYSYDTISVEEMQFCYNCYKKVSLFNKFLTSSYQNKK